ncbi:Translocon at the outer membrane of chloroplasts 64 [Ancistrocladus abbreviatus]
MASSSANLWVLLGLGIAGILIMTRKLKKAVKEDFGAFVERLQLLPPPQPAPPKAPHPLTGFSFAVSDIFYIEGYLTGFGHPDWARTHEAASQTASAVSAVVEGGATCVGKTVVTEMAYSFSGENKHYGTPTNPGAPARVPGGPSSGAAVAVAANLVDFSLGMDTVGGVRVPAGFCGIIGFRPSHGAISHAGVIPVCPSLDTIGCFAKDPNVLRQVVHVLLQLQFTGQHNPRQMLIADDCFELIKIPIDRVSQPVIRSMEKLYGRQILKHENLGDYISSKAPTLKAFCSKQINVAAQTSPLRSLAHAMQLLLRHEFTQNHQEWINSVKPSLDPVITAQMQNVQDMSEIEIQKLHSIRDEVRSALNSLLKDDGILVIPTSADPPPKLGGKEILSEDFENRLFCLSSVASMSGCCQVTVPLGYHDKCPVSVSFIARHGGDRFLIDTVQTMYATLQEQADVASKTKSSSNVVSQERSAEIAKEKGNQAFKQRQWQTAINFYTEAIKLNPDSATYYSNRAAAYLELGSFLQAEADCTKAIDLDKKNVKAYLRRGTAREMLGYYKEAIDDFRYALVLEPTNKRASVSAERLKSLFQ